MKVFLSGATGFIGTQVIKELLGAGHHVIGMARSDAGVKSLEAAGIEVHRGDVEDLDSLRSGVDKGDAVIHTAFVHDFSRFLESCEIDRRAIVAMGERLVGTSKPFIITSGTGMGSNGPGEIATEDTYNPHHPNPRTASEKAGVELTKQGVDVRVVRLPQVHDTHKQGLVTFLIAAAKEKGKSAYVGEGKARWPAVTLEDAAKVYRLVLEKGESGKRYHPVAEEGVRSKEFAESIGRGLNLPVVSLEPAAASEHFGWLGMFADYDMPASSALTQERLGWRPQGPGIISDMDQMDWSAV